MTTKFFISALLLLGGLFTSGCAIASGENSEIVQVVGDKNKAAGHQQDVPSSADAARLQEEARLANERAKLAMEWLELEKKKRELAEAQLKQQKENEGEQEEVSPKEPMTEDESSVTPPKRRAVRPRHSGYYVKPSYVQPAYDKPQSYPRPQPSYTMPPQQPKPTYQQQAQPAPTTIIVLPQSPQPVKPRLQPVRQRLEPVKSTSESQQSTITGTKVEKKKGSKWKKVAIIGAIVGGAVVAEEVIRRNRN